MCVVSLVCHKAVTICKMYKLWSSFDDMKKLFFLIIIFCYSQVTAQIFPDGTTIPSFSATDINNNFFSSTVTNNAGKHFIIDLPATWCDPCWVYHNTHVLDNYYSKFGPNGTLRQDAEVLMYEADEYTNSNDLHGIGTNTKGDYVSGTNYLIFNETTTNTVKSVFSANGILGYPTIFVVCSDRKMYRLSQLILNADDVRKFVEQKCGVEPLSASSMNTLHFEYDIYPNPAANRLAVDLKLEHVEQVSYSLINTFGQIVTGAESSNMNAGLNKLNIDLENLTTGIYLLNLTVGESQVTHKVLVSK